MRSVVGSASASAAERKSSAGSYYNPNVDHVTFEKMQRARTDETNGNYQEALRELLQIDAQGDFPKPVGADAPWSISPQSPEYYQLRLWEDHQGQLSWTREMIGNIYAEGRLGAQDLSRAAAWYEKAIGPVLRRAFCAFAYRGRSAQRNRSHQGQWVGTAAPSNLGYSLRLLRLVQV
jgi:hypothetical protein